MAVILRNGRMSSLIQASHLFAGTIKFINRLCRPQCCQIVPFSSLVKKITKLFCGCIKLFNFNVGNIQRDF